MRIFASDRVKNFMQALGMEKGEAIEHRMVTNAIEKAQRKVGGRTFDIRKQLLEFDDVANDHERKHDEHDQGQLPAGHESDDERDNDGAGVLHVDTNVLANSSLHHRCVLGQLGREGARGVGVVVEEPDVLPEDRRERRLADAAGENLW